MVKINIKFKVESGYARQAVISQVALRSGAAVSTLTKNDKQDLEHSLKIPLP